MKKPLKTALVIFWLLIGTIFLCRWWYANPDLFPIHNDKFWAASDRLFGAVTVDDQENVELFVTIGVSFLVVSLFAAIFSYIWMHVFRKL